MRKLIRYIKARREFAKRKGYMQIQLYPDQLPERHKDYKNFGMAYVMYWITPTHEKYGGCFILDLQCKVVTPMMADITWGYILPKDYVDKCMLEIFDGYHKIVPKFFEDGEKYYLVTWED